jgi:predicted metal-dependent HD superfamily phosphohydrolase
MPDRAAWQQVWKALGAPAPWEVHEQLVAAYGQPHRKYHTIRHLDECLQRLAELRDQAARPAEVELALWFHDAVYDVSRNDNEAQSASWARVVALEAGLPSEVAERVHGWVMATRHAAAPAEGDARIVLDVDLSILGAEPARFDEYELQVREEYAHVPGWLFRRRRRAILQGFLERPTIYRTQRFLALYEARARDNLRRSIERLA